MQNRVFVQKDLKDQKSTKRKNITSAISNKHRALRSAVVYDQLNKDNHSVEDQPNVWDGSYNVSYGKINITGTHLVLTGLPHFAEYQLTIHACQDTTAPEHFCSARPLWLTVRTDPILEYDMIDPESVVVYNVTDGKPNDKRIYWSAPKTPNGYVLAYRAKLIRDDGTNSISHAWSREFCVLFNDFEKDNGLVFLGLLDGHYTLEVRVETSTSLFNNATLIKDIFVLYTPGFFTPWRIVALSLVLIVLMIIIGVSVYYFLNRLYGKKVEEYWRQTVSAIQNTSLKWIYTRQMNGS
uniref:Fibronectin type-III domain-containing protein n=1 Tax=Ditylenchus dipsaci TaxID=166011 RepID=A0A915EA48_9BILA